jgi:putative FmdB family regulatory protein
MPTYAYKCADCSHQFDQFQKFSDDPLTECPSCSGKVRRVIQPVGVVFKGSGFYINDSRGSSSTTSSEKAEKPASSDAPAAKAESADVSGAKPAEPTKAAEPAKTVEKSKSKVAASA